jgi:hypothetical protein
VFRIVHDYFGHGILGNQFGAIGEENATLQHLDLYSDEAAPAVIFQTRGQNSWVNFSGANKEANDLRKQARELRKQGETKKADELVEQANKLFKFVEPKIAIFPTKFNFRRYETARRISEQEDINTRPNKRVDDLPKLLEKYSKRSSGTRGVDKRNVRRTKRIGLLDLNVVAEYTLDNKVDSQQNLISKDMKQQEESVSKKILTQDQIKELMTYPDYWRGTLREAAEQGESIEETYKKYEKLEYLM